MNWLYLKVVIGKFDLVLKIDVFEIKCYMISNIRIIVNNKF